MEVPTVCHMVPKAPAFKHSRRHYDPLTVDSWHNGPHNHHSGRVVRPRVTRKDSIICPRVLSSSSSFITLVPPLGHQLAICTLFGWHKSSTKWPVRKGTKVQYETPVLENKRNNYNFKRDKWKICTLPNSMEADMFWS